MALTRVTQGVIKPGENYEVTNINATGIITASSFSGDGSGLTNVSGGGIGDKVGEDCGLDQVFTTPITLTLGGAGCGIKTITASAATGNLAFVKAKNITISSGSTIHISTGTTVRTNILGLF